MMVALSLYKEYFEKQKNTPSGETQKNTPETGCEHTYMLFEQD